MEHVDEPIKRTVVRWFGYVITYAVGLHCASGRPACVCVCDKPSPWTSARPSVHVSRNYRAALASFVCLVPAAGLITDRSNLHRHIYTADSDDHPTLNEHSTITIRMKTKPLGVKILCFRLQSGEKVGTEADVLFKFLNVYFMTCRVILQTTL